MLKGQLITLYNRPGSTCLEDRTTQSPSAPSMGALDHTFRHNCAYVLNRPLEVGVEVNLMILLVRL